MADQSEALSHIFQRSGELLKYACLVRQTSHQADIAHHSPLIFLALMRVKCWFEKRTSGGAEFRGVACMHAFHFTQLPGMVVGEGSNNACSPWFASSGPSPSSPQERPSGPRARDCDSPRAGATAA
jgi:hypothetical protein